MIKSTPRILNLLQKISKPLYVTQLQTQSQVDTIDRRVRPKLGGLIKQSGSHLWRHRHKTRP